MRPGCSCIALAEHRATICIPPRSRVKFQALQRLRIFTPPPPSRSRVNFKRPSSYSKPLQPPVATHVRHASKPLCKVARPIVQQVLDTSSFDDHTAEEQSRSGKIQEIYVSYKVRRASRIKTFKKLV